MDIVPRLEGSELEFGTLTDHAGMVERYQRVRTTKRGVDRLSVAQSIIDAFTLLGGTPAFAAWAQTNQQDFYKMYAKQAPALTDVNVKGEFIIKSPLPRNPAFDGECKDVTEGEVANG
jgi:hypothetical protein